MGQSADDLVPLVPGSIANHPVCVLGKIGQVTFRLTEDVLLGFGLRVRHFSVLNAMADLGARSQFDLATYLRIDAATMVAIVDDLESLGLATRTRDPRDRRRYLIELTEKGLTALREAGIALDELERRVLGGLSESARESLAAGLQALNASEPLVAAFDATRQ